MKILVSGELGIVRHLHASNGDEVITSTSTGQYRLNWKLAKLKDDVAKRSLGVAVVNVVYDGESSLLKVHDFTP